MNLGISSDDLQSSKKQKKNLPVDRDKSKNKQKNNEEETDASDFELAIIKERVWMWPNLEH